MTDDKVTSGPTPYQKMRAEYEQVLGQLFREKERRERSEKRIAELEEELRQVQAKVVEPDQEDGEAAGPNPESTG
jgi:chromosome segregation ATPase